MRSAFPFDAALFTDHLGPTLCGRDSRLVFDCSHLRFGVQSASLGCAFIGSCRCCSPHPESLAYWPGRVVTRRKLSLGNLLTDSSADYRFVRMAPAIQRDR